MPGRTRMRFPKGRLAEFCRSHHIMKLSLFGSFLKGEDGPDSDVDLLVEFEPEHIPDLFELAHMQDELSDILGRKVDLRTPNELSQYFRDEVMSTAEVLYAEG